MNKVLEFFRENQSRVLTIKNIRVYGWEFEFDHLLVTSVNNYLFEDLEIIENIAPSTNDNRDGRIREKKYITIHDTGDTAFHHTAKFWSDTVKNEYWEQGKYACSFQYVTGNDGVYHNIPDDEIAYHAGDSTAVDYNLIDSNVLGTNENPSLTITSDGYYAIDGVKSSILAPRARREIKGEVIFDRLSTHHDFNDQGILCKLIDGKYYIGETYFNQGYALIANRGGNNNSIGIESCINVGSDIYLTWQKTAKLVAYLLEKNNLTFNDIKQHHYFSGKNCPQTIRMNGFWNHFIDLVKFEYQMIQFKKEGYQVKLICDDKRVYNNGRVKLIDLHDFEPINYTIQTIKDGKVEETKFQVSIK